MLLGRGSYGIVFKGLRGLSGSLRGLAYSMCAVCIGVGKGRILPQLLPGPLLLVASIFRRKR